MKIVLTMTWSEMQKQLRDDQAFHDLTVAQIIEVFDAYDYYNSKYTMTIHDTQDNAIRLTFKSK